MSGPGKGGKRAGAGRKPGDAWGSKRPRAMRKIAHASRINILENRDPLAELVRLGFEAESEDVRVKALIGAMPFVFPRLSMSVVADATPAQAERISSETLAREILDRIARLPTIDHEPAASEAETEGSDLGGGE